MPIAACKEVLMKKIYVKEEACIACHLCEVYCQVEHSTSKDLVKAFKKEATPVPRVIIQEAKPLAFSLRCQHCDEPACVYACLTGALTRNPDSGEIIHDATRCIGCWTCLLVCPFGAIVQDKRQGKMAKCDLCPDKETPVCVSNCPNEALVYIETPGK
jgi:anaerobic carbon-monoxide dehydrogenase iron sulfur subunit